MLLMLLLQQETDHEELIICVFNKREQAIVLPILPYDHVEVHTVGHPSLPAYTKVHSASCCHMSQGNYLPATGASSRL